MDKLTEIMAVDYFTLVTWIIFGVLVILNGFRLRIMPKTCCFDLSIYLGLIMGLIPVLYFLWEEYTDLFSDWMFRMEFGDFFVASSLFVVSVALDIQEKEKVMDRKLLKKIIGFFLILEGGAALIYLFTDIDELWTTTIVIYDTMSITLFGILLLSILRSEEKRKGIILTLVLFLIAFMLGFALFYSEEIFLAAVVFYYLAIVAYYSSNYEELYEIAKRKNKVAN